MRRGRGWRSSCGAGKSIPATTERPPGVDDEPAPDGGPAEQHAETHLVSPREAQFDLELLPVDAHGGPDDRSHVDLAVRAAHLAVLDERSRRRDDDRVVVLQG